MSLDELLDARLANAHQRKFSRREKGVGRNQEDDKKHPEQHKGNHGLRNSNITKELDCDRFSTRYLDFPRPHHRVNAPSIFPSNPATGVATP